MSTATAKLRSEFEALRVEEKQEFVREIIQHLPPWDSGPLSDVMTWLLPQEIDHTQRSVKFVRLLCHALRDPLLQNAGTGFVRFLGLSKAKRLISTRPI